MKLRKWPVISLVLAAGAAALVSLRWNAWFSNPPEAPYETPAVPDRLIVSLGEDASSARSISWRCDTVAAHGFVDLSDPVTGDTLRIDASDTLVASRSGKSRFFHAALEGLRPGTAYRYRAGTEHAATGWYDLPVGDTSDSLTFLMLGDIQDTLGGGTKQIFADLHARYPQTDFWAFVGDIIERPTDRYWNYWFGTMNGITQSVPVVAATGNHEYLKGALKKLDSRWISTFRNPANGPEGFTGRTYRLSFGRLDFFVIDTDGLQLPADYFRTRRWLAGELEKSEKPWKIVMMHHPVYSVRSGRDNTLIRWTFKPVFERYGVDLVLEGHDHGYSRILSRHKEGQATVPVYITSNCSPKLYAVGFDPVHDRLGSNLNFYQYITLKADSLSVRVYTTAHELYDEVLLVRQPAPGATGAAVTVYDRVPDTPESLQLPDTYRKSWKDEKLKKYEEEKQRRQAQRNG